LAPCTEVSKNHTAGHWNQPGFMFVCGVTCWENKC
jgi:hypothetical protein